MSLKSSIVVCYNIIKLTYLHIEGTRAYQCGVPRSRKRRDIHPRDRGDFCRQEIPVTFPVTYQPIDRPEHLSLSPRKIPVFRVSPEVAEVDDAIGPAQVDISPEWRDHRVRIRVRFYVQARVIGRVRRIRRRAERHKSVDVHLQNEPTK